MEKVERVACAFSTIIPSKSTLGIKWRKNNWVDPCFDSFFFGTVKVDVKSDRILISSFIERFNKLDRSLHYQEGASFLLCACTERRGAEIAWDCLRGQRGNARKMQVVETREGRIRLEGDIDRRYYVLNAYANSTQNSNYRFIVTSSRKSGKCVS